MLEGEGSLPQYACVDLAQVILAERPRVTEHMLDEARECAPDTFGAAYAQFMMSRKFSPDERPLTRFVEDPELAYVITR